MKKKLLLIVLTGTLLLVVIRYSNLVSYFYEYHRSSFFTQNLEFIHNLFLFFPLILFFSLLTYKMPQRVFETWWRFARVAIPTIFFLSALVNLRLHHSPGGLFNMDNLFDLPILITLYAVFVIGSTVSIARGYKQ